MTNIIISGKHVKEFPEIEDYAEKKLEKLLKFHPKIEKITANLISEDSHRDKNKDYYCDLLIDLPGNNLELSEVDNSMDKAIDKAVERMKVILVKDKEKNLSEKHRGTIRGK